MKILQKFLLIFLLLFPIISQANHMLGAEITYKYLGNKKYEVTAKYYRDCKGIPLPSPTAYVSDYNGTTITLNYTRKSIEDISIRCSDTVAKPCNPQNTAAGVELHTYVATIDFGISPFNAFPNKNACKIYFSSQQCCRSGSITTLNAGNLFIEAMLDICNSKYQNSSPQFKSINTTNSLCNNSFKQNFGGMDYVDYDSLAYTLANPFNDSNSLETYYGSFSRKYPMTPFCYTSGVINCTPKPTTSVGFYADSLNGDIVFQPTKCNEIGVIAMKVSEYRKDISSGKWILVGYVMRDLQITIINGSPANYAPTMNLSKTYNFKTRENQCIDITTYDTRASGAPTNNKGDKTSLSIIELPPGATYSYVDSTARMKTGRLCWKIHDSVYLKFKNKNKLLPLIVELRDNYCGMPSVIQKSFNIKILPPDSSGYMVINSYKDDNKNNKRESPEPGFPALFKCKQKFYTYYTATNIDGQQKDSLGIGKVHISVASHPYYTSTAKDTNLLIKMDSSHFLSFAVQQTKGIYGRIYGDANANCKFDKGEATYSGYKVFTDSNKYMGISDNNGIYCIIAPKGSYTLQCNYQPDIMAVNCPSSKSISISINGDSAYNNNDFGISRNMQYVDIGPAISISRLRRGSAATATYFCTNNSPSIRRNIKLYSPVNSNFDLKYNNALFAGAGTIATISIDSILPYSTFSIKLDFIVSSTAFKEGDKICFSVKTDSATTANDSLKTNNSYKECGKVNAPFDPNEKIISIDSTRTTLDQTIDYTIHFQNSGTDTAFRIVVKDTIDTQYLEIEKFKLNWSDYPCDAVITGNVIHFIFDNIRLPYLSKSGDKSIAGFNFTLGLKSQVKTETSFANNAAIYFDFEKPIFTKDAIATIVSPIELSKLKTSGTCKNERNTVYYKSNIPLDSGNQLILEMSDANGSFSSPTVLQTTSTTSMDDSIDFMLPKSLTGTNYFLRIKSTYPASTSIPFNGQINLKVLAIPGYTVNSNLINNKACEKDTLKINFSNSSHLYKVIRNNIQMNSFNNITSYLFPLNLKDSFKIIALDNSTGCKDTSIIYPLINMKPTITAGIANRKKDYCVGDQIDLKASGAQYYTYFKNQAVLVNKTTSSTQNTTININASYQILGEDMNGCSNLSDTLSITSNSIPVAAISASSNPVCSGKSISLNYGTAQNYDLYKNSVIILNKTTSSSYNVNNPVDGDKYKITAFSDKGCFNNSNELTIVVNPSPVTSISCNPNPVCTNDTAILSYGKASNYDLYKNNTLILNKTSDSSFKIINPVSGDKYKITAFSDKGCSTNGFELTIATKPLPVKPIISKNINTLNVNFTGNIKWYRNSILLTNTSNTITNAVSGTYIVAVTNTDGCSSSSNPFIHYHSGVNEILNNSFNVYPNPAAHLLTVETDNAGMLFGLKLYDMNGKLIYESAQHVDSRTIDISAFSAGLYTLKIACGDGQIINRMVNFVR